MEFKHIRITPACQGCKRLINPLDPKCKVCVNQNNFELRENELGIQKELELFERKNKRRDDILAAFDLDIIRKHVYKDWSTPKGYIPRIKKVIFNDPATIVYWSDGTKTVVKCDERDIYDPEKGLAMAISKKALGNRGNQGTYYDEFKKWLPEEKEVGFDPRTNGMSFGEYMERQYEIFKNVFNGKKIDISMCDDKASEVDGK